MTLVRLVLIVSLPASVLLRSLPAPSPLILKAPGSIDFLKRYGYLGGSSSEVVQELYTQEAVEDAIKQAQRFGGIPETGILDDDTIQLFASKRCGVPDIIRDEPSIPENDREVVSHSHGHLHQHHHHHHHDRAHRRKKRFVMAGQSWDKRDLKFYIKNYASTLSYQDVSREIQRALREWGNYGGLNFSQTDHPEEAEISIGFYRRQHGDRNPFDGRGNVLAHAFFPWPNGGKGLPGDVHFDDDEAWSIGRTADNGQTIDFNTVALHELGHSLGLSHSPETGSVMNPYYSGSNSLGDDDIQAMYELYVKRPLSGDGSKEEQLPRDETRRKHDQDRSEAEERERHRKMEEEEKRKRDEYEERKKQEREEWEKYEQEKRKREQQGRDDQKRIREQQEYEDRKEQEREEWEKYEQEKRKREQQARDDQKRIRERQEYEDRKKQDREEWEKSQQEKRKHEQQAQDDRRREDQKNMKEEQGNEKSRHPIGSTYEGDDETVEHHKQHDPTHRVPPSVSAETESPREEIDGCRGKFDAATYLRGELFFVKEKILWRISRPGAVQKGYPTEVHRFFHLLPKRLAIEAMYQREFDSSLIIFSGRQYWVFDGYTLAGPRSVEEYGLPRDVDHVDAVISRHNRVYLFSGDRYWSLNDTVPLQLPLQRQASLAISTLRGLPDHLDTALTYNDQTYFFKDDRFWSVDWDSKVATLQNSHTSDYWIGC